MVGAAGDVVVRQGVGRQQEHHAAGQQACPAASLHGRQQGRAEAEGEQGAVRQQQQLVGIGLAMHEEVEQADAAGCQQREREDVQEGVGEQIAVLQFRRKVLCRFFYSV